MNREEFLEYAEKGTVVPVYRELSADTLTPVTVFLRVRRKSEPVFLLESVEGGERLARYSFVGREPFQCLSAKGDEVTLEKDGESSVVDGGFFEVLASEIARFHSADVPGLPPLAGGATGYMGYDAVRFIEKLPDRHPRDTGLPDAQFHFFHTLIAFDHARHRLYLVANVLVGDRKYERAELEAKYERALGRIEQLKSDLERPVPREEMSYPVEPLERESIQDGMESSFTHEVFEAAVDKAKEYIAAGDAFQIVLSQRFQREV